MTNKPQFVGGRETVKLSEIAKIKAGNVAPKKDAFTEDGIPFVRAGSLTNLLAGGSLADLEKIDCGTAKKLRLTLFPAGTVVFAKSGMSCMTGNVYVLPEPCYVVSHLACVIPNGNYASYLKHYFRFNRPNRLIENPSFPSIKLSKIQGIELRLPSPEEVVKQVQAIERIESQIEQAKALFTYLDSLVKSRFVEMFESNEPNGFIPLRECCSKICGGKTPSMKRPEYYGGDIPFVKSGDIKQDSVSSGSLALTAKAVEETGVKIVPKNSVLVVTRSAMLHRKMHSSINTRELAINQDIKAFIPSPSYLPSYLLWAIRSHEQELLAGVRSVSTCALDFNQLCSIRIRKASVQEQQEFADFVAQVDKSRFLHQANAKAGGNILQSSFTSDIGSTFSRRLSLQEGLTLG